MFIIHNRNLVKKILESISPRFSSAYYCCITTNSSCNQAVEITAYHGNTEESLAVITFNDLSALSSEEITNEFLNNNLPIKVFKIYDNITQENHYLFVNDTMHNMSLSSNHVYWLVMRGKGNLCYQYEFLDSEYTSNEFSGLYNQHLYTNNDSFINKLENSSQTSKDYAVNVAHFYLYYRRSIDFFNRPLVREVGEYLAELYLTFAINEGEIITRHIPVTVYDETTKSAFLKLIDIPDANVAVTVNNNNKPFFLSFYATGGTEIMIEPLEQSENTTPQENSITIFRTNLDLFTANNGGIKFDFGAVLLGQTQQYTLSKQTTKSAYITTVNPYPISP